MQTFRPSQAKSIADDVLLNCSGDVMLVERATHHSVTLPQGLQPEALKATVASFCSGCEPTGEINVVASSGTKKMQWPPRR